tara:strand:+ start:1111 stop:1593 length:483 start_codon:yes stop_codon:yes gene_type:complete
MKYLIRDYGTKVENIQSTKLLFLGENMHLRKAFYTFSFFFLLIGSKESLSSNWDKVKKNIKKGQVIKTWGRCLLELPDDYGTVKINSTIQLCTEKKGRVGYFVCNLGTFHLIKEAKGSCRGNLDKKSKIKYGGFFYKDVWPVKFKKTCKKKKICNLYGVK